MLGATLLAYGALARLGAIEGATAARAMAVPADGLLTGLVTGTTGVPGHALGALSPVFWGWRGMIWCRPSGLPSSSRPRRWPWCAVPSRRRRRRLADPLPRRLPGRRRCCRPSSACSSAPWCAGRPAADVPAHLLLRPRPARHLHAGGARPSSEPAAAHAARRSSRRGGGCRARRCRWNRPASASIPSAEVVFTVSS